MQYLANTAKTDKKNASSMRMMADQMAQMADVMEKKNQSISDIEACVHYMQLQVLYVLKVRK